jgi:hypothetical protein
MAESGRKSPPLQRTQGWGTRPSSAQAKRAPLQKMIRATQILVPVRNPRRPAPKERKNAAHGASRGYERNKNYTSPGGA